MKRFSWKRAELCLALTILLIFTYASAAGAQQQEIADKVLRLHVLANSDSAEDQRVKLCVRDAVLEYCNPLLAQVQTQAQVRTVLNTHLQEIVDLAQAELRRQGSLDMVTAQMQEEYYPTRDYTDFALPAGKYMGLRICIGSASGHNWWCVIFPPLCKGCSAAATETLTTEERAFVRQDGTKYVVRFKAAEMLDTLRERFSPA